MIACRACGQPLAGDPATCPGCGRPVDAAPDWRTDTAERPRAARAAPPPAPPRTPRLPPSALEPPPPARWPLYADEVAPPPEAGDDRPETAASWSYRRPEDPGPGEWFSQAAEDEYADRSSPLRWVVAALLLVVLVGVGWWYLARDDGSAAQSSGQSSGRSSGQPGQHAGGALGVGAAHVEVGDQAGR